MFCTVQAVAVSPANVASKAISEEHAGELAEAALAHFILSGSPGVENGSWDGASISPEPLIIYDLNGQLLFYHFDVLKEDARIGGIKIGASSLLPASVMSIDLTPRYWGSPGLDRQAEEFLASRYPGSKIVTCIPVWYRDSRIGLKIEYMQQGQSHNSSVIMDAVTGQPIGPDMAWSYYDALPDSDIKKNLDQWEREERNHTAVLNNARINFDRGTSTPTIKNSGSVQELQEDAGLTLLSQITTENQQSLYGSRKEFSVILRPQETDYYCKVATTQMICEYYGYRFSQSEIARASNVVIGEGMAIADQIYFIESRISKCCVYDNTPTFGEFRNEIDSTRPFDDGIRDGGYNHARLIIGYDDTTWSQPYLKVNDPWPPGDGERRWEPYSAKYHQEAVYVKDCQSKPDFQYKIISCPNILSPGQSFSLSDEIKNTGSSPAGASSNYYYLSTDNSYSTNDYPLGYRNVPALSAGASNTQSATLAVPTSVPAGNYYLIIRVDANGVVLESDENNNVWYYNTLITVSRSVTPPVASFRYSVSGKTVTFTDTST
ncbi:MAG: hypothetical protein LLF84_01950, partial [Methanoregulaceae archaeon]|nr:hypothetical protein [Methanoregulaceae archaeon]